MTGGYVGQFLPLSGGKLTGILSLGGQKLVYDTSSVSGISAGSTGAVTETALKKTLNVTQTPTSVGFGYKVLTAWTLSGSVPATDLLVNRNSSTGSSTGAQLLADFQVGGTSESHLSVAGVWTANGYVGGSFTGTNFTGNSFLAASFVANTTIYVDQTNGDDSYGNGTLTNPFQSIGQAASVAAAGNLIFVSPGTYTNESQIVLPAGVSLKGSGIDVTVIASQRLAAGTAASVVFGNESVVSDLTINGLSHGAQVACIGCVDTATSGSQQFGLSPSMYRVKCVNTFFGLNYAHNNLTTTVSYLYCEDCIFISNTRCAVTIMVGDSNFSADWVRCQFLFTYSSSVSASSTGECLFGGTRLFNCILSMTDTVNTAWSSVQYQMMDSDNPLELYGCTCLTKFPNLPAVVPISVAGTNPGFMLISNTLLTKLGAGNTLSLPYSDIGQSLYQTLASPASYSDVFPLTVSSNTVAPWLESNNAQFEVAVDASSLTSNTLTIGNVSIGANVGGGSVAPVDAQRMRLRIKNANSGSTTMTLAVGSAYNTGSTTLSALAAGKRAYLEFCYDGDNSKWDLTGYVTGL